MSFTFIDFTANTGRGAVLCGVVWCVWCGAVRCDVMWCGAVRCGVVWCGAV